MPPKFSSRHHRPKPPPPPAPRPKLTKDELKDLATKMSTAYGWDGPPKEFQLRAVQAQIEGTDMIIQAPTGAGKTAIAAGPYLWPGNEKKFTLMVCPLLSLEDEMCVTFDTDFGLKAIALNSKNGACSPLKIREILALKYQIILISPEMLQSRTFMNRILRNGTFMRSCLSMVIDEAHCIVLWGTDFRKKYATLGKVRAFLPRGTPVIALSATVTPRVVRAIWASLHFAHSETQSRYVNEGNDRPNVSIVVRACEHPLNTYADLAFVIPPRLRNIKDIPKTYIYVNNIANGGEIIDYLNALLESHPDLKNSDEQTRAAFRGLVRPFNATLSHRYRNLAMHHFRTGEVRILVCTDAAGMGCNIPDIDRVVQWKLPSTFSHWIQRAGRAARGRGRTGLAVLLVERSAYNVDLVNGAKAPTTSRGKTTKGKTTKSTTDSDQPKEPTRDRADVREYAIAHGLGRGGSTRQDAVPNGAPPVLREDSADEGLSAFVQSPSCRRRLWARVFDNPHVLEPTVPCCDICDPTLFNKTRPPPVPPERRSKTLKRGEPDVSAQKKLREWRKRVFTRDHSFAQYDHISILDDDLILILVSHGPISANQANDLIQDKWPFYEHHTTELGAYVAQLPIEFVAKSRKRATSPVETLREDSSAKRAKTSALPSIPGSSAREALGMSFPGSANPAPTPQASIHASSIHAPPAYSLPQSDCTPRPPPRALLPPTHPVHPAQPQPSHPPPVPSASQQYHMLQVQTAPLPVITSQHGHSQRPRPSLPPPPPTVYTSRRYSIVPSTPVHAYPPSRTPSRLQSTAHSPIGINPLLTPAALQAYSPPAMVPSQLDHPSDSFHASFNSYSLYSQQPLWESTCAQPQPPSFKQPYYPSPSRPPSRMCPTAPESRPSWNYPPLPPPSPPSISAFSQPVTHRQVYSESIVSEQGTSQGSSYARPMLTPPPLPSLPLYHPSSPSPFASQLQGMSSTSPYDTQYGFAAASTPAPTSPPPAPSWAGSTESALDTTDYLEYAAFAPHPYEDASFGAVHHPVHADSPEQSSSASQYLSNHTPGSYSYSPW